MNRAASQKFAGWSIHDASYATALCGICDAPISFSLYGSLPDFLDALLDHDWVHDPLAATAPLEVIDERIGRHGMA